MNRVSICMCICMPFSVFVCAIGCGPKTDAVAPVSGRITVDGKPVKNASIQFYPTGKRAAGAITDDDGRYRLSTYGQFDGAVLGEHKIAISLKKPIYMGPPKANPDPEPTPQDDPSVVSVRPGEGQVPKRAPEWKSPVPDKYGDETMSGLTRVVEDVELNVFDFDLSTKP